MLFVCNIFHDFLVGQLMKKSFNSTFTIIIKCLLFQVRIHDLSLISTHSDRKFAIDGLCNRVSLLWNFLWNNWINIITSLDDEWQFHDERNIYITELREWICNVLFEKTWFCRYDWKPDHVFELVHKKIRTN